MNTITNLDARTLSDGRIFRIREKQSVYDLLRAAEKVKGSIVIFDPGSFDMPDLFEIFNIWVVLGHGKQVTRITRHGNALFRGVQRYAHVDFSPEIGQFTVVDAQETTLPALEFGGSQGGYVHDIFTEGAAADLLQLTNAEPTEQPPIGHAFGTWTENWTVERIMISGCNAGGIRTRVLDPQRRFQSFCNLHIRNAQIGLLKPGCIGVDFGDHSNAYFGHFDGLKFNIEKTAIDPTGEKVATCVNVQNDCSIVAGNWDAYVEGDAIRDPETKQVITPAGRRITVDPSALVKGCGRFWRQDPFAVTDLLQPGLTWSGLTGGVVHDDILCDQ